MTIEEIRKGAPKGSTHYGIDDDGDLIYFQKTNNIIYWDETWDCWDVVYFELPELKPL